MNKVEEIKRTETRYILKHVSGKYFKNTVFATSYDAFLTDDILQASIFPTKEIADTVIKSNKGAEFKYAGEFMLRTILMDCSVVVFELNIEGKLYE